MSSFLPPEILDLIVDHLHDEPTTLRACCLVSKSWVPRTRIHLFNSLEFHLCGSALESWMETFPDPSSSPAHYARSLCLSRFKTITVAISDARPWILSFNHIVELEVLGIGAKHRSISFAELRGISPTLKHLHISNSLAPLSEVVDFICSLPLLEDLLLHHVQCHALENTDSWDAPLISPRFNGSLLSSCSDRDIARKLLDLPCGLHFSKIRVSCQIKDCDLLGELVYACSDTLEYLDVDFYRRAFSTASPADQYLITACRHRRSLDTAFTGSLQGYKAQGCGVPTTRAEHRVDQCGPPNYRTHRPPANRHSLQQRLRTPLPSLPNRQSDSSGVAGA